MAEAYGALTEAVYYILLSLNTPLHGYGIIKEVERATGGRLKIAPGTLYGALATLEKEEWIKLLPQEKGSRRKEYVITEFGKDVLEHELRRLEELVINGRQVLRGEPNE